MLRSKKLRSGKYDSNSYRSPDSVNSIKWSRLEDAHVQETLRYYQGLLALRREHSLFRIADAAAAERCISLAENTPEPLTVFRLEDKKEIILAAFNPGQDGVNLSLPAGSWQVCVTDEQTDAQGLSSAQGEVSIPGISAFVAVQAKD